ncbi:MAG: RNA chaperone Hfq [Armatimonadetes bacterium]|nr:RNA chaperone Hfq [Armatimonadota bacterium]
MIAQQGSLQDKFLNCVRREGIGVVINLVDGSQLRGNVKGFDNFTILLEAGGKRQLIYKHGITSILPAKDPSSLTLNNAGKPSGSPDEE